MYSPEIGSPDEFRIKKFVASAITFALLTAAVVLVNGLVTTNLWRWFAVPLGLPVLTFWHATGIHLVVAFMTRQGVDATSPERDGKAMAWALFQRLAFYPGLYLLIGWIVRGLMVGA